MAELLPPVGGVHEAALYVRDLGRAERFWRRLGFPLVARAEGRHAFFRVGRDMLLLFDAEATSRPGTGAPPHGATGQGHVAFDVPGEAALDAWRAHLATAEIAIELEHTWPNGGRSIYFRDPDGNSIELITRTSWGF